ncbi:helix-turn-helix transcriptional regulator [Streptomyces qinglanensis]|uniref:helix-turn-helix transcriptional regulator n=1 Tax=Streptomyces qinglanensis TaxID=943816 RepID=UPI003D74F766
MRSADNFRERQPDLQERSPRDPAPRLKRRRQHSAARYRVGTRIRAARLHANLSQEDVAEQVGLDRKTIYRIELGTIGARLDWLVEISHAVGAELADLVRE